MKKKKFTKPKFSIFFDPDDLSEDRFDTDIPKPNKDSDDCGICDGQGETHGIICNGCKGTGKKR